MAPLGRFLVLAGIALAILGGVLLLGDRVGLGRLPGDIVWRRKGVSIHLPIVTSLVLSVVLTILANLLWRRK